MWGRHICDLLLTKDLSICSGAPCVGEGGWGGVAVSTVGGARYLLETFAGGTRSGWFPCQSFFYIKPCIYM